MREQAEQSLRRVERAVSERGGVARISTLQREGISRHYIRRGIELGRVHRVSRDWVASREADRELVRAARLGAVLTCITQARRLGLWVLAEDRPHLAVSAHARGDRSGTVKLHWNAPLMPRHPDLLADSIENALVLVSHCQPHDAALVIWESALRKGLVERGRLGRMPLPARAAALLAEAQPFADSGLETLVPTRLRWLGLRILSQIWLRGHHVDHLIGDLLVVQIDGGHHVDAQRASDNAHDAALRLLGYTVLRFGYHQVIDDWPSVQSLIMSAIAQGLHRAS